MKKAIIFVLGVSCISGSAPEAKKLMPRRYNPEATQKLQEQMNAIVTFLQDKKNMMADIQTSALNGIQSSLEADADPNAKTKLNDEDLTLFDFLLILVVSHIEKSDYQLVEGIIKSALQHGMDMVISSENVRWFMQSMRTITKESPDAIKTILNMVEKPQQREQNLNIIKKFLQDDIALEQEQVQNIKKRTDRSRQILEALESKQGAMPVIVNIK